MVMVNGNRTVPIEILLVEDSPGDVRLTQEALKEAKVLNRLSIAVDGVEAMEFLRRKGRFAQAPRPDLILLDLSLPDSQGLDTLRTVHARACDTPIVVLTGTDDETLGVAAVRHGAQDYLVKGRTDARFLVRALSGAIEKCVELIRQVRDICHGLYPPTLASFGLTTALRHLAEGSVAPAPVMVRHSDGLETARYPPDVEIALYRIAQEAVHNALKHSGASRIEINIACDSGALVLSVTDDGVGFDPAQSSGKGLGFISMIERARTVGGQFAAASRQGETRIEVRVPVEHTGQSQ